MEAATDALSDGANDGIPTRISQASTTSPGKPDPSAPTHTTSGPAGMPSGVSPASGIAATVAKPASLAASRNATDSTSRATGAWNMDPIDALTVLGLYRSAHPVESATPAPKAWAERMAVPTFPGSWTPCSKSTRRTEESSSPAVTSRKGKTPTGPAGVLSVETRRNCSTSSKTCKGVAGAAARIALPSAKNSRSASRRFLVLSLAARFGEIAGVPGIPGLLFVPGGPLDVADGDAPSLARPLHAGEVHVQFLGLARGGFGRRDVGRLGLVLRRLNLFRLLCRRLGRTLGGWAGLLGLRASFYLYPTLDRLPLEGVLRLGHDGAEDLGLRDGEVGQDLAVEIYLGEPEAVDEPGVGEAVLAGAGVDALDPERPEVPLALLASLVGIDAALPDLLLGPLVRAVLGPAVAFRLFQHLATLFAGVDAACGTCHATSPPEDA